jgi:hypothetical protein
VNIFDKPKKKDAPKKDTPKTLPFDDNTYDEIEQIGDFAELQDFAQSKEGLSDEQRKQLQDLSYDWEDAEGEMMSTQDDEEYSEKTSEITSKALEVVFGKEDTWEEPKSEPSKPRPGNPQVNKVVSGKAKKLGITPQKLGKEEYEKRMSQAAVEALTDANFHSESRALIAVLEDNPELAKNPSDDPNKPDPFKDEEAYDEWKKGTAWGSSFGDSSDGTDDIAHSATGESSWDGQESIDAIAHDLKMNGSHKLAAKIQSIFDEKNESSASLRDLLPEGLITEAEQPFGYKTKFAQPIIDIKGKGVSHKIEFTLTIGPNSDSFGWIVLDFIPKGKKMLDLYNSNPTSADQVAKWVTSKIKLPTDTRYQPKNRCRVLVNTNSILKKLK